MPGAPASSSVTVSPAISAAVPVAAVHPTSLALSLVEIGGSALRECAVKRSLLRRKAGTTESRTTN